MKTQTRTILTIAFAVIAMVALRHARRLSEKPVNT